MSVLKTMKSHGKDFEYFKREFDEDFESILAIDEVYNDKEPSSAEVGVKGAPVNVTLSSRRSGDSVASSSKPVFSFVRNMMILFLS